MVQIQWHLVEVTKDIPIGQVCNKPYQLRAVHTLNFFLGFSNMINGQDRSYHFSLNSLLFIF